MLINQILTSLKVWRYLQMRGLVKQFNKQIVNLEAGDYRRVDLKRMKPNSA